MKVHRKAARIETQDMIGLLGDKYNLKILTATGSKDMSVMEMIHDLDIPIISCYRRIKELQRYGLIQRCEGSENGSDKRFRSNLQSYRVRYTHGNIVTEVSYRDRDEPELFSMTRGLAFI